MRNPEKGDGDLFPAARPFEKGTFEKGTRTFFSEVVHQSRRLLSNFSGRKSGQNGAKRTRAGVKKTRRVDGWILRFFVSRFERLRPCGRISVSTARRDELKNGVELKKGVGDLFCRENRPHPLFIGESWTEQVPVPFCQGLRKRGRGPFSPGKPSPSPFFGGKRGGKGPRPLLRGGRSVAGVIGFFVLFTLLLLLVYRFYMIPWIAEAQHATKSHLRKMSAEALLLMCVLLAILFSGLLVTFRISRFFVEPSSGKRSSTKVVDAWTEAGKRLENDPPADDEEDADSKR